jgi:hypothetical protein
MKNKQFVQHDKNAFLLNECLIIKQPYVKVYSKTNILYFFAVVSSSNVITDIYCLQHQAVYRNFDS